MQNRSVLWDSKKKLKNMRTSISDIYPKLKSINLISTVFRVRIYSPGGRAISIDIIT